MEKINFTLGVSNVVSSIDSATKNLNKATFKNKKAEEEDGDAKDMALDKLLDKGISSDIIVKCIEHMIQNIDRLKKKDERVYNDLYSQMVCQGIRNDQLVVINDMFKDIEFLEPELIERVFQMKSEEHLDQIN